MTKCTKATRAVHLPNRTIMFFWFVSHCASPFFTQFFALVRGLGPWLFLRGSFNRVLIFLVQALGQRIANELFLVMAVAPVFLG